MEKLKAYGCLLLFGISCFIYGAYTYITINTDETIEPHRWILTGMFGLFFLLIGISKIKELKQ